MPKGLLAALCARPSWPFPPPRRRRRTTTTRRSCARPCPSAGIREHMAALQAIGEANGGNRLAGFAGHDASAAVRQGAPRGRRLRGQLPRLHVQLHGPAHAAGPERGRAARRTPPASSSRLPSSLDPADNEDVTAPLTAVDLKVPSPAARPARPAAARPPTSPGSRPARSPWSSAAPATSREVPERDRRRRARAIVIINEGNTPGAQRPAASTRVTTGDDPGASTTTVRGRRRARATACSTGATGQHGAREGRPWRPGTPDART